MLTLHIQQFNLHCRRRVIRQERKLHLLHALSKRLSLLKIWKQHAQGFDHETHDEPIYDRTEVATTISDKSDIDPTCHFPYRACNCGNCQHVKAQFAHYFITSDLRTHFRN